MTLEGPTGPSSVVLCDEECLSLAEAIASARPSAGRPHGVDGEPDDRPWTVILDRVPRESRLRQTLAHMFERTEGDRDGAAESSRIVGGLRRLRANLRVPDFGSVSPAGRVLLAAIGLAEDAWAAHGGFERAVVEARLDAMKQLAYGAGHEINNPLANIATRAQALLPGESDPGRRRRLAGIIDQAFRARDMIGGLMLFARPPRPAPSRVDVLEVVEAARASVGSLAAQRGIALLVVPPACPIVGNWDRSQIEESVRSVLTNAVEAGRAGGTVRIEIDGTSMPDGAPGCVVRIADDGPGMDRQTLATAFDPFFSGREAGRGLGLGLPKVWRLIEINGGRTSIESRYTVGTTVSLVLPVDGVPSADARRLGASSPA